MNHQNANNDIPTKAKYASFIGGDQDSSNPEFSESYDNGVGDTGNSG